MEMKQLVTFHEAAEQLNFTRTADRLNFAQSSVTAHIKALEDELGVRLFDRLGRGLKLTEAGKTLQRYADRILSLSEEAGKVISAQKEPSGLLVIGATESLCTYRLPPVLSAFKHQYEKVRFHFLPGASDQDILQQLIKGNLDAAVLMDAGPSTELLHVERLRKERIILVAAADHRLSGNVKVKLDDIAKESLLLTEKGCSYRQSLDQLFFENQLIPEHVSEFASVEAIKQCVLSGLGVALLPEMTVQNELKSGLLRVLPWGGDPLYIHSQLVWLKDKWVSPALSVFLSMTQAYLKES